MLIPLGRPIFSNPSGPPTWFIWTTSPLDPVSTRMGALPPPLTERFTTGSVPARVGIGILLPPMPTPLCPPVPYNRPPAPPAPPLVVGPPDPPQPPLPIKPAGPPAP